MDTQMSQQHNLETTMPYLLDWYKPNQVIYLEFNDTLTVDELKQVNHEINRVLDASTDKMYILINANRLRVGYQSSHHLRDTQQYMNHPMLDSAFIISHDKLTRLIMLIAFSLSRAKFFQFDTMPQAEKTLHRFGLSV
jgi:hypothetical protein